MPRGHVSHVACGESLGLTDGRSFMTTTTEEHDRIAGLVHLALEHAGTARYGQGVELTASTGQLTATCDQLSAIAGHIAREYGDYGYVVEYVRQITPVILLAQVPSRRRVTVYRRGGQVGQREAG